MKVRLSEEKHEHGVERGKFRRELAENNGVQTKKADKKKTDLSIDILGGLCEVAANIALPGSRLIVNNDYTGDTGYDLLFKNLKIDVKGRFKGDRLIIPEHADLSGCDYLCQVYQATIYDYYIKGFISVDDFNQKKIWWADMPRPCWGVEDHTLLSVENFIQGTSKCYKS